MNLRMLVIALMGSLLVACSGTPTPFDDTGHPGDAAGDVRNDLGTDAPSEAGDGGVDTDADVVNVYDATAVGDACPTDAATCTPADPACQPTEACNNGLDDNCDGQVDEGCPCLPGTVQSCFQGPPGFHNLGACSDGTQRCQGGGEFGTWGACEGGISPSTEICDHLDNNCNGCTDEVGCCDAMVNCPGPGDPRVPDGTPFTAYTLHGEMFFPGAAQSWNWTAVGGPCDTLLPHPTFTFTGTNTADPVLTPTLSGDYTITMTVVGVDGVSYTCTFVVHIAGPGLRVELCWDTSTTVDLDLYLHDPSTTDNWFNSTSGPNSSVTTASCNWSDCEAVIRGTMGRENWGYANSPLSACVGGPHGPDWTALGYCSNPRLDIDNNLSKASGLPENINIDDPRGGQLFRVMVQNYTGTLAHPMVNVYCGGSLRATLGAAPDTVPTFSGESGSISVGAMWRAADVRVFVDVHGVTTCNVTPLHPVGATSGYFVTNGDPSY